MIRHGRAKGGVGTDIILAGSFPESLSVAVICMKPDTPHFVAEEIEGSASQPQAGEAASKIRNLIREYGDLVAGGIKPAVTFDARAESNLAGAFSAIDRSATGRYDFW
jgi:hypothetical protein